MALVAFGPAKEGNDIRARHRAAQPARDGFAFLDPANALLDGGGMGDSICRGRSAPTDSAFDAGDELLLPVDLLFVELVQARPKLLVCLGVLELQRTPARRG